MEALNKNLFLGVDGGQSHTEAVIADENGIVVGRGSGGPSNHAEQPGGRERLRNAVIESVASALGGVFESGQDRTQFVSQIHFRSAHFGMTGGAEFKEEVIGKTVNADLLTVGHDAPIALLGATGGGPGVVVIAGTGSVVYADNGRGNTAQVGGLGYLFSDEGSGFWLAAQTIRLAIAENDGLIADTGLANLVLGHFGVPRLGDLANGFYNGVITRDEIARFSRVAHDEAVAGNSTIRREIEKGAIALAEGTATAADRAGFVEKFNVSGVGGMFKGTLMKECFRRALGERSPMAVFGEPIFGPAIGALLIAYKQAGLEVTPSLANALTVSQSK